MESPPSSPISFHSPPSSPPPGLRAPQRGGLAYSYSSSMESVSWRQPTYSRTSSDDSLYLPMVNQRPSRRRPVAARDSSEDSLHVPLNYRQTIKRWNGITREAISWNSLPRDPELFFPTGNCLVYLYPAGHSQRGPSFRIPYHLLLYSGCRPLVQQCLVSRMNISSPDHVMLRPLSHGAVNYSVSQDARSYLYLYPPTGLSRDEGYSYHITTRNFFAWLLGVPLVGTDPVSALLDLKARMDIWRDPHTNNLEAIFEYARQQAYGDFEEIQVEMDKRTESERKPGRMTTLPLDERQTRDGHHRHDAGTVRRSDSFKRKLRSSITRTSKSHIALQDKRVNQGASGTKERQPLPRLTTFSTVPTVPSSSEIDRAIKRISGPARTQSPHAVSPIRAREMAKTHRHTSSSTSNSPVSPLTPVDSNGIDAALQRLTGHPSTESVATASNSQTTKATKKKHRVSWADNNPTVAEARLSQTDVTYPNMQGLGLQSAQASSSAINVGQSGSLTRRSLSSLPLSSHQVARPSKRMSMPATSSAMPWGDDIRLARPMSTASLVNIPTMQPASTPVNIEECSCCGKPRRPNTASTQNHGQQSRPASVRSLKSFRSTRSWRSLRSIRSSLSLRSIRSYFSRSQAKRSFADIQASMKHRRATFKERLSKKMKKPDLKVDTDTDTNNRVELDHAMKLSCNPGDYAAKSTRLPSRYQRASLRILSPAPVELEAKPVVMKTVPELTSSDTGPWSPESYSDSPPTPTEDQPTPITTPTTTIRPKEIYTSREYRHQPKPRRTKDVSELPGELRQEDVDPDSLVLDMGTPGGLDDDFLDTLLGQLEQAGISERVTSQSKGKARADDDDEEGMWMGVKSSFGVPMLQVRAMG